MKYLRLLGIWVFGLLASGIAGAILGNFLDSSYSNDGGFAGFFGGLFAFACIRLWLGERRGER